MQAGVRRRERVARLAWGSSAARSATGRGGVIEDPPRPRRPLRQAVTSRTELELASLALLEPLFPEQRGIRLLGITLSALNENSAEANAQLRLMM